MKTLTIKPFTEYSDAPSQPGDYAQQYIQASQQRSVHESEHFRAVCSGKSESVEGAGMSYYARLEIFSKETGERVYDTGFQLYRPGHALTSDRPHLDIIDPMILDDETVSCVIGYHDGSNIIRIIQVTLGGKMTHVDSFNKRAYDSAIEAARAPEDEGSFESWVSSFLKRSSLHSKLAYSSERYCIVVARHCSRSFDAAHDWFRVFVWDKTKGVAIGHQECTDALSPHRQFQTNYMSVSVSFDEETKILHLSGKLELAGGTVESWYQIQGDHSV